MIDVFIMSVILYSSQCLFSLVFIHSIYLFIVSGWILNMIENYDVRNYYWNSIINQMTGFKTNELTIQFHMWIFIKYRKRQYQQNMILKIHFVIQMITKMGMENGPKICTKFIYFIEWIEWTNERTNVHVVPLNIFCWWVIWSQLT